MVDKEKEIKETADYVTQIIKGVAEDDKEAKELFNKLGKQIEGKLYEEKEPAWYIS